MVDIRRKESGSGQRLLTAYVLQDCDRIGYLDLSVAVHVAEQHHEFCLVAASVGVAEGCEDHTGRALYGGIGYERSVSGVRADGVSADLLGCYERRKRGLCARDSREYGSAVVYGFRIAVGFAYGDRASLSYQAECRLRTERGRRDIDNHNINTDTEHFASVYLICCVSYIKCSFSEESRIIHIDVCASRISIGTVYNVSRECADIQIVFPGRRSISGDLYIVCIPLYKAVLDCKVDPVVVVVVRKLRTG